MGMSPTGEPALHRRDLSRSVAASLNYDDDEVDLVVQALLEQIVEGLANGNRVNFRGFGRFEARDMPPTERTVPGSRQKVMQPAHVRILFKPSDQFRTRVHTGRRQRTTS
jgi:nucleoid DNA-binding protein